MSQTKSLVLFAGGVLSLGAGSSALAQQQANPDQVRAIVAEMLADAETRSSLLAGGPGAGHDGRFFLAGDGFRLNIGGMLQLRYLLNFRDKNQTSDREDFQPGFQTPRTKLFFDGNINNDWFYAITVAAEGLESDAFATSPSGTAGTFAVSDAYAGYNFGNGWKAQWGQFKLPFLREELVDSRYQLAVERSVMNETFNQDYSQGFQVSYETENWRVATAFSDGFASRNTDFTVDPADYAFTGRFEFKFAGGWPNFNDFTSKKGDAFAGMFGVAAHYQDGQNNDAPTNVTVQNLSYTADVSLKGDSWNLYAAAVGRHLRGSGTTIGLGGQRETDDFGGVVQGGFRFTDNTEVFGRWDAVIPDHDNAPVGGPAVKDFYNFLTVGLNQYYAGHAAKATLDLLWALDDNSSSVILSPSTRVGLLGQTKANEVVVRLQFQLLF